MRPIAAADAQFESSPPAARWRRWWASSRRLSAQRDVLLADSPRGYFANTERRQRTTAANAPRCLVSVAVIRESGVHSLRVGDIYYVGHLPWFERPWYALANHPVLRRYWRLLSGITFRVLWRSGYVFSVAVVSTLTMSNA